MYSFLIIDDHSVVREGYKNIIGNAFTGAHIAESGSLEEAYKLLKSNSFNLIILDISLPNGDGLEVLEYIKTNYKDSKVLVSTMHNETIYATRTLALGANGFICKDSDPPTFKDALVKVLNGGRYLSQEMGEKIIFNNNSGIDSLSKRELQVLRFMAKGILAKQIGEELNLSVKTINTYRARILSKLGLSSTAELINYAIKNNII